MSNREPSHAQDTLRLALVFSVIFHGLVLLIPQEKPRLDESAPQPLQARLVQQPPQPAVTPPAPAKPPPRQRILSVPGGGKWSVPAQPMPPEPQMSEAEKEAMKRFLNDPAPRARPAPTLADRSLAMAHQLGREIGRQEDEGSALIERIPNSPPVDPFSLEMYLDGLVKKLNRSASFVQRDPRARGVKAATVHVRLNPDGSLKSFEILKAGDQQLEIAFVRGVVEQALPFSPFPADLRKSAQSLSMHICIQPPGSGGGGFGFTRNPGGRGC